MTTPIQRLGSVSKEYQLKADEYMDLAISAAQHESFYRKIKAQTMLKATAEGASAAKAEIIADADPQVSKACWDYKVTAATVDAAKAKLTQLREQIAVGRSMLVTDRELDKLHANGIGGGA